MSFNSLTVTVLQRWLRVRQAETGRDTLESSKVGEVRWCVRVL